ncbi:DUF1993 domain-containing protein [Variovorax sp. HJSM1_2]|uniref:DUF1993 domain-containing protein n=1 Tax=Variovorax sp. HJSM1_2 TaxID=3366263 RepID=UPI003BDF57F8
MSVSMYRLTLPLFTRGLNVLAHYLDAAQTFATQNNTDPQLLVDARLAPNMLSLAGQIQRASDTSKNAIGRLTSVAAPRFEDNETSLAQLQERITNTIAFFDNVPASALDGAEHKPVALKFSKLQADFSGDEYLLSFVLPNFYFHVATAHGILRHQGVPIGKADYLGPFTGAAVA